MSPLFSYAGPALYPFHAYEALSCIGRYRAPRTASAGTVSRRHLLGGQCRRRDSQFRLLRRAVSHEPVLPAGAASLAARHRTRPAAADGRDQPDESRVRSDHRAPRRAPAHGGGTRDWGLGTRGARVPRRPRSAPKRGGTHARDGRRRLARHARHDTRRDRPHPQRARRHGSAVLNASRQVGGVIGIALLGSLIGGRGHFMPGLHWGMLIAGALFLMGSGLSWRFVERGVRGARYAVDATACAVRSARLPPVITRPPTSPVGHRRKPRTAYRASQRPFVRTRSLIHPRPLQEIRCPAVTVCSCQPSLVSPSPPRSQPNAMASTLQTWIPPALPARTST